MKFIMFSNSYCFNQSMFTRWLIFLDGSADNPVQQWAETKVKSMFSSLFAVANVYGLSIWFIMNKPFVFMKPLTSCFHLHLWVPQLRFAVKVSYCVLQLENSEKWITSILLWRIDVGACGARMFHADLYELYDFKPGILKLLYYYGSCMEITSILFCSASGIASLLHAPDFCRFTSASLIWFLLTI